MLTLFVLGLVALARAGDVDAVEAHATPPVGPHATPPAGHPVVSDGSPAARFGPVLETMNSGGYTYARMAAAEGEVWIATPERTLAVGDQIATTQGALMANFKSLTLDRTFEWLWLVSEVAVLHGAEGAHAAPAAVAASPVTPLAGGFTVERILASPESVEGREVVVRARVARVSTGILDRTWLHVQDGTGKEAAGTHDLVVTTQGTAAVGDVIEIRGTVARNRDFGAGYTYAVILEDAVLTNVVN